MPINAELQKWLVEKAYTALSPEEQQAFNSIIGKEAVAEQLNRAWMAPPDYNRKMNELQEKEKQLNAELQQHVATLQQWRTGTEAEANRQVAEIRAQHERDVAALRAQLEGEGLQPSVAQPAKSNGAAAPTNSNGHGEFLTKAEAAAILRDELTKAARFQAEQADLAERHRQLFGKTPDMQELMDAAIQAKRPLGQVWYEKYKVGDREAEIQKAAIQKQIEDGVNERLAKLQADGAMSHQNFTGRPEAPSPIRQMLMHKQAADANSPLAIPQATMQQSEGVNAAVEALRSGKYAVKYPGQS